MHEGYWGLMEPPFAQVTDSKFYYMCEAHQEAIMMLHYGLCRNKGAVLVTGALGMGKTMLCRKLISLLDPTSMQVLSIVNAQFEPGQLANEISTGLGIQSKPNDLNVAIKELRRHLNEQYSSRKRIVVFMDDAHLIEDPKSFEQLRMLLSLQVDGQFLINFVLAGRASLVEQLALFEELDRMFAVRERLEPLRVMETRELICHRLKTAGLIGNHNLFSPEAMLNVHCHTKGVPRLVCQLADRALVLGKQKRAKIITAELIQDAASELYGEAMEDAA